MHHATEGKLAHSDHVTTCDISSNRLHLIHAMQPNINNSYTSYFLTAFNVARLLTMTVVRHGSAYIIVSDRRPLRMRRHLTVTQPPSYHCCFLSHGAPAADQIRFLARWTQAIDL